MGTQKSVGREDGEFRFVPVDFGKRVRVYRWGCPRQSGYPGLSSEESSMLKEG